MYTTRWLMDDGPLAMARRLGRFRNGLDGLLGVPFEMGSAVFPLLNLWVKEDEAIVEAELPGVDMKDIEVSVVGDTLTISGERKKEKACNHEEVYHRCERRFGSFNRAVELPFKVEPAKVSARCRNGVLRVILPRSEQDKARKIDVVAE